MDNPTVQEIFEAIGRERAYQDNKHGTIEERPKCLAGWLLIMQHELGEALVAWNTSHSNDSSLMELLQVAAVGVACLEQHCPLTVEVVKLACHMDSPPDSSYAHCLLVIKNNLEAIENFVISSDDPSVITDKVGLAICLAVKAIERYGLVERPGNE